MDIEHEKERYYVLKDSRRKPKVVVCLIRSDDGHIVRGVAVCGNVDRFELDGEHGGKEVAYTYAMQALCYEHDDFVVVRNRSVRVLRSVEKDWKLCGNFSFNCHSYYAPRLTEFEKGLLSAEIVK